MPPTERTQEAAPQGAVAPGWEPLRETPPPSLVRRFFTTHRHILGMLTGALVAHVRTVRQEGGERARGLRFALQRLAAACYRPFLDRELRDLPFPVQFRRRLEILGPTYIKLGQVLSLRDDLLPKEITDELKNLLDRLPVVSFERYLELVREGVGKPIEEMFAWVDPEPLGSASIAQTHRARTVEGDDVILKVVKPNIAETLRRDAVLLKIFGSFLELFLSRFQPRRVIDEFVDYTLKEVDLRREADNAETFAANFKDMPDVVFPRVYRQYSGERVLCMEFLDGFPPTSPRLDELSDADRERLIDIGATAIIRMLYKDGFFHADLHAANLLILPGPKAGFIDLGMVGRFDEKLRRTLLYYYYCLVMGDSENAARFLAAVAEPGPRGDPDGFRREVEEISRRWFRSASFEGISLARLIMESVSRAAHYRMYFPVELVLMVKALVTFEGVGHILRPGFDVAKVSQRHISRIFIAQFSPVRLAKETLRGAPEVVDALVKAPLLITEGLRYLEAMTKQPRENPLNALRGSVMGGFCLVAGAILAASDGPWPLWAGLFALGALLFLRRSS